MKERQFHKDLRMFLMQLSIYSYEGRDPFAKGLCVDALASIPQWIPVEERLPEEGGLVLVCMCGVVLIASFRPDNKKKKFVLFGVDGKDATKAVTHWMKLPEPPEVK